MKRFYLLFICLLSIYATQAQPWLKNLPQNRSAQELTLFDYQQAFESYWAPYDVRNGYYLENGEQVKAAGWKQFKRWEYLMEGRVNPTTGAFPDRSAIDIFKEYIHENSSRQSTFTDHWMPMGPDYSYSGYAGIGRLNCVAFHPTDLNTYWVGAAAGGLWATHDDGATWACMTDNNGVLAVSDIIIPSDYDVSHTIYIATGDRDGWDNRSIGVLKSTNGGHTWKETALSFSIYEERMVNRLLIDPDDDQVIIAATTIGVYKTTDGGTTWDRRLTPTEFIDMESKPGDFQTLYGSTKDGKVFVTSNGGDTWRKTYDNEDAGRIELAVAPTEPTWLYAVVVNSNNGLYGIYKSQANGLMFQQIHNGDDLNLLTWSAFGGDNRGQGYYDLCCAVSPTDANTFFVGGINTWRTEDGGASWQIVNHWHGDQCQEVHADKHNLRFRHNGDLFETNDGGIYISRDNGNYWVDKTNGIQISQMYKLGVSQTDRNDVITGLQDNGTKFVTGGDWRDVIGGDGMECLIDHTDGSIQYGTLYYGNISRTLDKWQSKHTITPVGSGSGAWVTPYAIDPLNPEILYMGFAEVWKSYDRGDNWEKKTAFNAATTLRSICIAPLNPSVIYLADLTVIRRSNDGGDNWINITQNLPSNQASIRYISVKHDDPNTVWVALGGFTKPGVYESKDGGQTWTDISEGLPPVPVYTVIQNKFSPGRMLFAGTEIGVFYKRNNLPWQLFNEGLPNVYVSELEIYYDPLPEESRLRAATYGRGLWEAPITFSFTPIIDAAANTICENTSASLILSSFAGEIQWQQSVDGEQNWTDVTEGLGFHSQNFQTIELTDALHYRARVIDPDGDTLYTNTTLITVVPKPQDAGPITGQMVLCEGDHLVEYSVAPLQYADEYIWTLPAGATGHGNNASITINFHASGSSIIEVAGKNAGCSGNSSALDLEIFPQPATPSLDEVIQPTCELSTGEISFSNLPSSGEWTIMDLISGQVMSGGGEQIKLEDLLPGTYEYHVLNEFGCSSPAPVMVTINSQPETPEVPHITAFQNAVYSSAPVGNQWHNEDGPIPGATGQFYLAFEDGLYYTIVTIGECSSGPSNTVVLSSSVVIDTIIDQGTPRTFIVHLPAGYDEKSDYPIVINLHGLGSTGLQQQFYSQFDAVADAEGFIVVYPDAVNNSWNLFGDTETMFISNLVDSLRERYSTSDCLFFTGMSQGGFLSYKLACELDKHIDAIAVVTGNMTTPLQFTCNAPDGFPMMHFHGTEDATVPYNGTFGIPPVENTMAWWAEENNCDPDPLITSLDNIDPNDGSTVERYAYGNCELFSEVILYKITGGGHTWPGAVPLQTLGNTNQDIHASTLIGNFFTRYCNEILSVDQTSAREAFQMFPNPAQGSFTIEYSASPFVIRMYTLAGQLTGTYQSEAGLFNIDIPHLPTGMYMVTLINEQGKRFSKLLVKH